MKVFYVEETLSFNMTGSTGHYERVSDYYYNREDAEKYMKDNFPESLWNSKDGWNTIGVVSEDLEIK